MVTNYLITGATGLIGSALVKKMAKDSNQLICPVRNIDKARLLFDNTTFSKIKWIDSSLVQYINSLSEKIDYIIHCASPTASKYFIDHPVETMRFNTETTTALLEFSKKNEIKGFVYLSSLESYGTVLDDSKSLDENYQGYVNPMETRSSYNMAKRMCESLCHAYAVEYNVPVKVVRLTQTISPYIDDDDKRVFAQFARLAATGKNIELHTNGTSARQYIHIDDAINAILCVLYNGEVGEVYNAAREDSYISIKDMAQFVQDSFNPSGKVVFCLRDDMGYAPMTKLKLNTEKLRNLGWEAKYGLYEMFRDVILHLKRYK